MVSCRERGLSLIEVIIVVSLITVLMAMSLPMLSHANAEARSVVCRQNLAEIGTAVTGYMRDYGRLPKLVELPPHQPGTSLPELISQRLQTPSIAYCPSDETDRSQLLGTSYHWATAYNGMELTSLERALDQPLLNDRENFHQGTNLASNELVLKRFEGQYQFTVTGSEEDELDPDSADIPEKLKLPPTPPRKSNQSDSHSNSRRQASRNSIRHQG